MKSTYHNIALQAGGSHYPDVGGDLLEKFGDLLVKEILQTINEGPHRCAYTSYDQGMVNCTIEEITSKIKTKFEL